MVDLRRTLDGEPNLREPPRADMRPRTTARPRASARHRKKAHLYSHKPAWALQLIYYCLSKILPLTGYPVQHAHAERSFAHASVT